MDRDRSDKLKRQAELLVATAHAKGFTDEKDASKIDDARLATVAGINRSIVGRYLRGEVKVGEDNAPRLSRVLGLSISVLLYGVEEDVLCAPKAAVG